MQRASLLLLFCGLTAGINQARAQTITAEAADATVVCNSYSGTVANQGKPLASVSVMVEGTNIVVITNYEGFFNLPDHLNSPPVLSLSAAGYAPQKITYTSCTPVVVEMQMLPGTRIRKHGKRKGQMKKDGIVRK